MEMEAGCLLDTGMLGEDQSTEGHILLGPGEGITSAGGSCIPSSMDFEFTNSDLGSTSDFSIDHSSMFDISESVIDEKGDCGYLFKDSSIFEDVHIVKQSGELDGLGAVTSCTNKKTNVCNDLGLRLQIIPLDNLQFVSTIQTSEGLHILAVPAGSNLSVAPQISSIINTPQLDTMLPHTANSVNFVLNDEGQNLACPLSTAVSQINSMEVVSSLPDISEVATPVQPQLVEKFSQLTSAPVTADTLPMNFEVKQDYTPPALENLQVTRKPVVLSSNSSNKVSSSHRARSAVTYFPHKVKSVDGKRHLTQKGKICKESKIVIDLRKLARKNQMVSLLNNPRTKTLLHLHSQKTKLESEKCLKPVRAEPINDVQVSEDNLSSVPDTSKPVNEQQSDSIETLLPTVQDNEDATQNLTDKPTRKKPKKNSSLKHKATVEGNFMKKIFTCSVCFSKFNREGNYKNHLLLHQNSKLYNMTNNLETTNTAETEIASVPVHLEPDSVMVGGINGLYDSQACDDSAAVVDSPDGPTELFKSTELHTSGRSSGLESSPDDLTDVCKSVDLPDVCKSSPKLFKCELCSMVFSSEGNLTRHKLTHSIASKGDLRFSCEVCKKSFLQRCDLKRHQTIHTGQFPFTCSMCSKGFIRRSDLTVHERFHLKEKNFKCDLCSKAYYQSGDLHRHIRKSHSSNCEFSCSQCERRYSSQKSLNQHLTKHLRQRN